MVPVIVWALVVPLLSNAIFREEELPGIKTSVPVPKISRSLATSLFPETNILRIPLKVFKSLSTKSIIILRFVPSSIPSSNKSIYGSVEIPLPPE